MPQATTESSNIHRPNGKTSCPICGKVSNLAPLCTVGGYSIYQCSTCSVDFTWPMPTDQLLKEYYDREQWFEGGEPGGYSNYDAQTEASLELIRDILDEFPSGTPHSILDIGCGYGNHLKLAKDRGWNCFGIEPSVHARAVAQNRLGSSVYIVDKVENLIPHAFDLILILDVIEHLKYPYSLFYQLFSIGAITPQTKVIVTTPNAGCVTATTNPADWAYRHPPSHLVFYTKSSLEELFSRLLFDSIKIIGQHPLDRAEAPSESEVHLFEGLLATLTGSRFADFIHERYVPGTWSKIAEYEHLPRYALAGRLAKNKNVLDFGCGSGYGSAALAPSARSVIGLDIDRDAIAWAAKTHCFENLAFIHTDDLDTILDGRKVDLVTCFEMIEHVDFDTQKEVISTIARILTQDGILIISTPNPEITAHYAANPYHVREMNKIEFVELLETQFKFIRIFEQQVRVAISFNMDENTPSVFTTIESDSTEKLQAPAFVAICSNSNIPQTSDFIFFDDTQNFIEQYIESLNRINSVRLDLYNTQQALAIKQKEADQKQNELDTQGRSIFELKEIIENQEKSLAATNAIIEKSNSLNDSLQDQLNQLHQKLNRIPAWLRKYL